MTEKTPLTKEMMSQHLEKQVQEFVKSFTKQDGKHPKDYKHVELEPLKDAAGKPVASCSVDITGFKRSALGNEVFKLNMETEAECRSIVPGANLQVTQKASHKGRITGI